MEAFFMSGAGGQTTLIIPYDLVVVRLGHYKGSEAGNKSFKQALALLMEAVPRRSEASRSEKLRSTATDFEAGVLCVGITGGNVHWLLWC
jgi:hypothetical protein